MIRISGSGRSPGLGLAAHKYARTLSMILEESVKETSTSGIHMARALLVHWNEEEADERVHELRSAGFEADKVPLDMPEAFRLLREEPPDVVLIDLSRLPSAGRDVALSLRTLKATRHVPIVFVGGTPDKVDGIKKFLPDAVYTNWGKIRASVRRAIEHPPAEPIVPRSRLEGYSVTPLPRKLGVKDGSLVCLIDAPRGFEKLLGYTKAVIHRIPYQGADVAVWFVRSRKELEAKIAEMLPLASKGGLWIAWPKRSSGEDTDLSQAVVRNVGLSAGIVDYKISSFDSTWSGLRFTSRRSNRHRKPNTSRK